MPSPHPQGGREDGTGIPCSLSAMGSLPGEPRSSRGGHTNSPRPPHPQLFQLHGMQEPLGAVRPRARHLSQAQFPAESRGAGLGTPTSLLDPASSALESVAVHRDSGSHHGSSWESQWSQHPRQ